MLKEQLGVDVLQVIYGRSYLGVVAKKPRLTIGSVLSRDV